MAAGEPREVDAEASRRDFGRAVVVSTACFACRPLVGRGGARSRRVETRRRDLPGHEDLGVPSGRRWQADRVASALGPRRAARPPASRIAVDSARAVRRRTVGLRSGAGGPGLPIAASTSRNAGRVPSSRIARSTSAKNLACSSASAVVR
ncbi:hypothetical protein AHOG_18120 [Actinoalloteichus hoggarensis]|uniref:Uncharacterized protein n=1 Tax=Actinoalloteichus hoggarensis TaxID=1470176 RepID=A0A221W6Q3_9PSEU|nr:hypothetical protein AHOG_18120 [Actinoalloteichus hoggarensis]